MQEMALNTQNTCRYCTEVRSTAGRMASQGNRSETSEDQQRHLFSMGTDVKYHNHEMHMLAVFLQSMGMTDMHAKLSIVYTAAHKAV